MPKLRPLSSFIGNKALKENIIMSYITSKQCVDLWQKEFFDVLEVLAMGAKKYKEGGWLDSDGAGTSHKQMHDSMFHHLAQSYSGVRLDDESQLDHLLHVATRALMLYTRTQRGIKNPLDKEVT